MRPYLKIKRGKNGAVKWLSVCVEGVSPTFRLPVPERRESLTYTQGLCVGQAEVGGAGTGDVAET